MSEMDWEEIEKHCGKHPKGTVFESALWAGKVQNYLKLKEQRSSISDWISVKNMLSPINENVLFFNGKKEIRFGFFRPDPPPVDNWASESSIWINDLSYDEIGVATYWMPLPGVPNE